MSEVSFTDEISFKWRQDQRDVERDHMDNTECMVSVKCEVSFEGEISFVLSWWSLLSLLFLPNKVGR